MPVYEYQCKSCNHRYSAILSIKDSDEAPSCPDCGSDDVRKLVSSVAVVRSAQGKAKDRAKAVTEVDPSKPQEVAKYLRIMDPSLGRTISEAPRSGTTQWIELRRVVRRWTSSMMGAMCERHLQRRGW